MVASRRMRPPGRLGRTSVASMYEPRCRTPSSSTRSAVFNNNATVCSPLSESPAASWIAAAIVGFGLPAFFTFPHLAGAA